MSDYAGELSLEAAWAILRDDPAAILMDVRTEPEWRYVGVPVLDEVGKVPRLVQWVTYPGGDPNPDFLAQATEGLEPGTPVLLLCRSGARSLAAARILTGAGFGPAYNVSAGFEGPIDEAGHRSGGWRHSGLAWRQS